MERKLVGKESDEQALLPAYDTAVAAELSPRLASPS